MARYPRVILNEEMIRFGMAATPPIDAIIKGFVHQDETDGIYYVNFLRVLRMAMAFEKEPLSHIRAIGDHIDQYLRQEIPRISGERREQVLWFKNYFAWATDRRAGAGCSSRPPAGGPGPSMDLSFHPGRVQGI